MAAWKQILISVLVLLVAGFAGAKLSPTVAVFMASHGLAVPMAALGLMAPADPSAADGKASAGGGTGAPKVGSSRKSQVVLQIAGSAIINDKVAVLGTGTALQSVIVLPKANGILTEVDVQSGAEVTAGQVIARLDSSTQEIARDKAKLALADAERTLQLNKVLVQNNAAPANQTQSVDLAAKMADLSVRSAEQDLSDRVITAPIPGVVGIVRVSLGNAVTPQTQIVAIVDSSSLVVNFWLPERLAGQVKVGDDAELVPVSRPEATLKAKVTSIDNQVDPASGTFEVQAQVLNTDGSLQPGMAFTVALKFVGQTYVTVDPLAVQWGSGGAFVWRFAEGKVQKVAVRIVQRNTENVLVAGGLKAGDQIVTEGLDGLKQGADVDIFGKDASAALPKPVTPATSSAQAAEAPASGTPTLTDKPKKTGDPAATVGN